MAIPHVRAKNDLTLSVLNDLQRHIGSLMLDHRERKATMRGDKLDSSAPDDALLHPGNEQGSAPEARRGTKRPMGQVLGQKKGR